MCVQYRGECSVPWGYILSTVGDILSTVGVFSNVGDIMMHVGDIMSIVEGVQYRGGKNLVLFECPTVLMISSTCIMISHGTQIWKDGIPPRYWTPPRYSWYPPRASWYPPRYWTPPMVFKITPTVLMISPTVLNTPTILKISPPHLSWFPPWYWTPHGTQDIPHGTHDYPPRYLWLTPTALMIIPHGTAHTLYRVVKPSSTAGVIRCNFFLTCAEMALQDRLQCGTCSLYNLSCNFFGSHFYNDWIACCENIASCSSWM